MTESFTVSVGIDCGSQGHQVCVLDRSGHIIGERRVEHTGAAIQALAEWLLTLGEADPSRIRVAIEVPRGAIVDALLERGFHVYAINPKQLDQLRQGYSAAGAKDDRRDAWVLAHAVQTDARAFRALRVDAPQIIQLRELSRLDAELGEELVRTANRLRDQLHRYYSALLTVCPAADEPWLWELLALAPTPVQGQHLRLTTLRRLLKQARIRRFDAVALQAVLQTLPLRVAPGTVEAASHHVCVLLPHLQLLHAQRLASEKHLTQLMETLAQDPPGEGREHPDVTILLSLPGVGVRVGATMLAEASQPLKLRDYHATRMLAGLAPVTKASGTRRVVVMRYACNHRLRTACYHWARTAIQHDATARRHYTILRQAGHTHSRTLRGVADRLLAVLIGMLRSGTLYDHQRRRRAPAA